MSKNEKEEKKRRFKERWAYPIPDAPPKSRAIAVAVDAQTAENARTRPDSIRVATRDESGATRLVGPRRYSVDAGPSSAVGWISWGRTTNPGLWFEPDDISQVRHVYDPLDALKDEELVMSIEDLGNVVQAVIVKDQAQARIDLWLDEYVEGISDHKAEAVSLARKAELNVGDVEARFNDAEDIRAEVLAKKANAKSLELAAQAPKPEPQPKATEFKRRNFIKEEEEKRKADAKRQAEEDFLSPPTQPSVEDAAKPEPEPVEPVAEPPKPEAKAEPEKLDPDPEPGPKVSGEPNPQPELAEPEKAAELQAAALPMVIPSPPAIGDIWGQALAEMNRSHAVIESVGGKTVIASWEPSAKDDNRMEWSIRQRKASFFATPINSFPTPFQT
jgi:hypothetical protein